jgi:pSer/pThr/pTyr-binding forkhead associated (FHA) protein
MKIRLITIDQGHHVWEIALREAPTCIGRSPQAGIRLDDELVSDVHCQINELDGAVYVQDAGSERGTFVDGVRVTQTQLRPGHELTVGRTHFRLAYTGGSPGGRRGHRWPRANAAGPPPRSVTPSAGLS